MTRLGSTTAKVLAIVVFFAPALKLFRFETHARSALIPFQADLGTPEAKDWNEFISKNSEEYQHYTLVTLETFYIAYLISLPSLAFLLCGLKGRYFATFYSQNSRLAKR